VRLLTDAFDPAAPRPAAGPIGPLACLAAAMIGLTAIGTEVEATGLWPSGSRALRLAAVHGGLLAGAVALEDPDGRRWRRTGLTVAGALLAAGWLSETTRWGWTAYLLPPLVLGWQEGSMPGPVRSLLSGARLKGLGLGLLAGAFLGCHLLVTAVLTFGYSVGVRSLEGYVRALAYDAGANALSAGRFFHGALFSWLWRRLDFWQAAAGATGAALARYLLDPALPPTTEVAAGAVFYLSALGVASCALRARMAEAAAAYAATLAFFAAYRTLGSA
jgi:hypothetical protein